MPLRADPRNWGTPLERAMRALAPMQGATSTIAKNPGRCPGLVFCGAFSAAVPGVLPYIKKIGNLL
jgi:hypothetical protein